MIPAPALQGRPLFVHAAGACTSVGASLASTDCALRAGMDHFRDSDFSDRRGAAIRVASLVDASLWGRQRLARWAALALLDCLRSFSGQLDLGRVPVLLLAAERERPHSEDARYQAIYAFLEAQFDQRFHPLSRIAALGRTSIGPALELASDWLLAGESEHVLIVGADSYLDSASVNHCLAQKRLRVHGNPQGFIPGEAAAAVLVSARPMAGALQICGVGVADEPGRMFGEQPSRAQGLSAALRQAMARSGIEPAEFDLRVSDQNGEAFYAREAAHALTRLASDGLPHLHTLTVADCVGEVGAALGPLMLAWLSRCLGRSDAPGRRALAHLAGDDGTRVALALSSARY